MVKKKAKKVVIPVKNPTFYDVKDEYLDIDLSHLRQYADLALEEQGLAQIRQDFVPKDTLA